MMIGLFCFTDYWSFLLYTTIYPFFCLRVFIQQTFACFMKLPVTMYMLHKDLQEPTHFSRLSLMNDDSTASAVEKATDRSS